MTKEVGVTQTGRQQRYNKATGLSVFWLVILILALVGAIVAAASNAPVIWMLVWPAPLIVIFTAARFIREGYHKHDGVLVLGRPISSQLSGLSDSPNDDIAQDDARGNIEAPIAVVDPLSVPGPSGRIKLGKALDLAKSRMLGQGRGRSEKRFRERKRFLAHT
jgi:hypothetical protein